MRNRVSRPNNTMTAIHARGLRGWPMSHPRAAYKLLCRPGLNHEPLNIAPMAPHCRPDPYFAGSSPRQLLFRNFAIPFWQSGVMRASAFIREA